jgi:hypothetical protein
MKAHAQAQGVDPPRGVLLGGGPLILGPLSGLNGTR